MTMDEITKLVDAFADAERSSTIHGGNGRAERASTARAALLRAVEGIVGERDEAMASDAESIAMYRRARDRAEAAEAERDEVKARVPDPERIAQMQRIVESNAAVALACHSRAEAAEKDRDAANETARRIALTAAGYVGALLAGGPDVVTVSAQRLVEARLPRVEARPGGGVRFTLTDTTLGEALDRIESASPPPAALREPWTDCNDRKCGRCARCRGLTRDGVFASPPAALSTETAPTPTKSEEDPHHG